LSLAAAYRYCGPSVRPSVCSDCSRCRSTRRLYVSCFVVVVPGRTFGRWSVIRQRRRPAITLRVYSVYVPTPRLSEPRLTSSNADMMVPCRQCRPGRPAACPLSLSPARSVHQSIQPDLSALSANGRVLHSQVITSAGCWPRRFYRFPAAISRYFLPRKRIAVDDVQAAAGN